MNSNNDNSNLEKCEKEPSFRIGALNIEKKETSKPN